MILYSIFYLFTTSLNCLLLLSYSQFKYYGDNEYYLKVLLTTTVISCNISAFCLVITDYLSSTFHPLIEDYMYIIRSLGRSSTDKLNGYLFSRNLSDKIFLLITFLSGVLSLTSIINPYWDVLVYFNLYIASSYLQALIFTNNKIVTISDEIEKIDHEIDKMESTTPDKKQACEELITNTINELNVVNMKICKYWNAAADIYEKSILVASMHLILKLTLFLNYIIKANPTQGRCNAKANLELLDFSLLISFFFFRAVYFTFIEFQIHDIKKTVKDLLEKQGNKNARIRDALLEFSHTHETIHSVPNISETFFRRVRKLIFIREADFDQSPIATNIAKDVCFLTLNLFFVMMSTEFLRRQPSLHANHLCNLYDLPNTYAHKAMWFLLFLFVKGNVLEKFCGRLCNNYAFEVSTYVLIFFLFHASSFYNL